MIDFAQLTGSETNYPIGTGGSLPGAAPVTRDQVMNGLNPLHYVPVVGTIYRMATGEQIPMTMRVAGAALTGGPLGVLGAAFAGLIEELIRMGPDTTRPPTPAGMAMTGSEAGMQPVTPGTLEAGAYTTLATIAPDWMTNTPNALLAQQRGAAFQVAASWTEDHPLCGPGQA